MRKFSIVIPAYNEEKRLEKTLFFIDKYLRTKNLKSEIIVISDGSKDGTIMILNEMKAKIPQLVIIEKTANEGKGSAVRDGMLRATGDYILFTDADLSAPIEELDKLLKAIEDGFDVAIGSRRMRESKINISQPWYRKIMGFIFQKLIRFFVIKGFRDTQCGFKLFTRQACKHIFSQQLLNGFAFDIEVLYLAIRLGYSVAEVPVEWNDTVGSKVVPLHSTVTMLKELAYIRLYYALYYPKVYERFLQQKVLIGGEEHAEKAG